MKTFIEWINENSPYDIGDRLQPEPMPEIGDLTTNALCDIVLKNGDVIGFVSLPRKKYEFLSTRKGNLSLSNLARHSQVHMSKFGVPQHAEVMVVERPKGAKVPTRQDSSNVWNRHTDSIY